MRKTIFTLGLMLAAALSLTSCSKNEEVNFTPELKPSFELFANLESRTTNDGMSTNWAAGDAINVFHAVATSDDYKSDGSFSTADASGLFKGNLSEELDQTKAYDWYAFYPYSSYVKTPASTSSGYMPIGCKSNQTQTQNGNNSMAHIAGTNYPLYGVAKGVAASETPSITMSHASSLVEFVVKNGTGEDFVVESIAFTAPEDIVGTYYINFASEPVVYTKSGDAYVSSTATLTVEDGEEVTADGAMFYMGIKPFTAKASSTLTVKITTDKGTFEKSITLTKDTTFAAGKFKTITVNVDEIIGNEPSEPSEPTGLTSTISFATLDQRDVRNNTAQVWTNGEITFTNNKAKSTSNVGNYHNPVRLYKSSEIVISSSVGKITKIEFNSVTGEKFEFLKESLSAFNPTVDGQKITIVLSEPTDEITIAMSAGQAQLYSLTVTYTPADASAPIIGLEKTSLNVDDAAASEAIAVTLMNINESDVNITCDVDWVKATLANGVLTLNIEENTDTAARTATVTISASEISETITINQEGVAKTTTIDMITAAGNYSIANAWVVATYAQGCLITDSSNKYILCYMGYNATNIPAVGTVVNVEGAVSEYGGLLQFGADSVITATGEKKTVDHGTVTEMSGADLDAYLTKPVVKYASFEGTLNISNSKYYNVTVSGASTAIGSISYPTAEVATQLTALNGKGIKATGYLIGISSGKYTNMMVTSVEATGTTPEPEPEPEPEPDGETATATIDFTAQGYTNGQKITSFEANGVTVTLNKGSNSNAPKYYTAGDAVRVYGGNYFTVSSESTITKIELTFGTSDSTNEITTDGGSYSEGVWTGSANSVTFTIDGTKGNRRIQKIVVYTQALSEIPAQGRA